jgi:phenylacetic acid degradation protein
MAKSEIKIHPTTYVHPSAILEGTITIGKYCRIGAGTIIDGTVTIGDYTTIFLNNAIRGWGIKIGSYVNIFDNANIESGRNGEEAAFIGDYCWINHGCVMHGTKVGHTAVIGMNAAMNYGCTVGDGAIVMEGSACPVNFVLPDNAVAQGVPAKIIRENITDADREELCGLVPKQWVKRHAEGNVRMAKELGIAEEG